MGVRRGRARQARHATLWFGGSMLETRVEVVHQKIHVCCDQMRGLGERVPCSSYDSSKGGAHQATMLSFGEPSSGMTVMGYFSVLLSASYTGVNSVTMTTVLLAVSPPPASCGVRASLVRAYMMCSALLVALPLQAGAEQAPNKGSAESEDLHGKNCVCVWKAAPTGLPMSPYSAALGRPSQVLLVFLLT